MFQKLFAIAKESETIGDQEKAYASLFKYYEFVKTIQRLPECKIDKLYYDSMVSSRRVKDAFDNLDKLTIVLIERYNEKESKEALFKMKTGFKGQYSNYTVIQRYQIANFQSRPKYDEFRTFGIRAKKAKEKLQTDVECQYQIQKVWLKNSEDQVSKLH